MADADMSGLLGGNAIQSAYSICQNADASIDALLAAVQTKGNITVGTHVLTSGDYQSGAGTLIVDRMMSELSNLESLAANSIATLQRIAKEINSKLS